MYEGFYGPQSSQGRQTHPYYPQGVPLREEGAYDFISPEELEEIRALARQRVMSSLPQAQQAIVSEASARGMGGGGPMLQDIHNMQTQVGTEAARVEMEAGLRARALNQPFELMQAQEGLGQRGGTHIGQPMSMPGGGTRYPSAQPTQPAPKKRWWEGK